MILATTVTMRIFVMGLAAALQQSTGELDVALVKDTGHIPVLVFPCSSSSMSCAYQAANVSGDLWLPPDNFDQAQGVLTFDHHGFGAVELKPASNDAIKITILQPLTPVNGPAGKKAGRHHDGFGRDWYNMVGEVPQTAHQLKDSSWLLSLHDLAACADAKPIQKLATDGTLAAYFTASTSSLGDPIVASVGELYEYSFWRCDQHDGDSVEPFAVSFEFDRSGNALDDQNQAAADAFYYLVKLTVPDGQRVTFDVGGTRYYPEMAPGTDIKMDVLIGNVTRYEKDHPPCAQMIAPHGHLYQSLLADQNCKLPTGYVGWISTRMPMSELSLLGNDLPDILGVVSVDNATVRVMRNGRPVYVHPTEGTARTLCYSMSD